MYSQYARRQRQLAAPPGFAVLRRHTNWATPRDRRIDEWVRLVLPYLRSQIMLTAVCPQHSAPYRFCAAARSKGHVLKASQNRMTNPARGNRATRLSGAG